jgi:hypothetical protein
MSKSGDMMQVIEEIENDAEAKVELLEGDDHEHKWTVDSDGNGLSDEVNEHSHQVLGFLAMPSTYDGHVHRLDLPKPDATAEWVHDQVQ